MKKNQAITLERIGLNDLSSNQDQINRYELAVNLIKSNKTKSAIDCACGVGYGTELLSNYVDDVVGVDIDKEAIEIAKKNSKSKNVKYYCSSIFDLKYKPVDLFVSFETIEHVNNGKLFLEKIKKTLKKNGLLILSTPNGRVSTPWKGKPRNQFHVLEYFPEDLISLVSNYFQIEAVYGQYPKSKITLLINALDTNLFINWCLNHLYKKLWRFYKTEDKPTIINTRKETVFRKTHLFSTNFVVVAKNT